ncbi:MAG: substrate-binding domain-containing protein [Chitinophagaceae bacterium]
MKRYFALLASLILLNIIVVAQQHQFDPPWNTPPESSVKFTVPGIDNIPDLFGDINDPQLVVFFAGNQFMCVDDLLAAFKKEHPQYQRIFVETLPPGILSKQMNGGSLTVGNMRITLKPDIYTATTSAITKLNTFFADTATYAHNSLAIMVRKGNPKNIKGLSDLGRSDIKISMPNPQWEGIGTLIEDAYVKAGGEPLRKMIMETKVKDSSTYLTQIHHRQSPMRILYNESDAAPVWYSEVYYQQMINHPVEVIRIPPAENVTDSYCAGLLKTAPHAAAAIDFMNFLKSAVAKAIYKKYGFDVD